MSSAGRKLQARALQFGRDAMADLLDQNTPFGRLALTHVLSTAGDTMVTISLAGSLFFSISPEAAKSRVILYLLLTAAPFAVVAPLMGPVIDKSRGARRALVVASTSLRALVCVLMAGHVKSLLLFPLAFMMLVLSKVYLVTKGALVPVLASRDPIDPSRGQVAAVAGEEGAAPVADAGAIRSPRPPLELSVLNAKLGLLASIAGLAAALPAVLILKLGGASWVLYVDLFVFAAAAVAGSRLPVRRASRADSLREREPDAAGGPYAEGPYAEGPYAEGPAEGAQQGEISDRQWEPSTPLEALSSRGHPEVVLAATAMSLLRGLVGFTTFLLAFELREQKAATWWFGYMLGASTIGAVVGVLLVPRVRKLVGEPQMLALSVWAVALAGAIAAFVGGRIVQGALAFVLGLSAAAAKPAFDALVQRYVPPAAQGRAFARFETRLQLVWVVGALLPVIASMPFVAGDIVVAAVASVAAATYMTGRQALIHRRS
ncbi:MAG: MFS transporter [Acidimicrobiales bacterium]